MSTMPVQLHSSYMSSQATSTTTAETTNSTAINGPRRSVALVVGAVVGGTGGVILILVGVLLLLRNRIARRRYLETQPQALQGSPGPLIQTESSEVVLEKNAGTEGEQAHIRSDVLSN